MELEFKFEVRSGKEAKEALEETQRALDLEARSTTLEEIDLGHQNVLQKAIDALRIQLKAEPLSIKSLEDMIEAAKEGHLHEMRAFINRLLYRNFGEDSLIDGRSIFIATASDRKGYQVGIAGGLIEGGKVTGIDYFIQDIKRRRGIGRLLHSHVMRDLKTMGVARVESLDDLDEGTISFLKKIGYQQSNDILYLDI